MEKDSNEVHKRPAFSGDNIIVEHISATEVVEYEKIRVLGTGTFSKVYECEERKSKEHFAIKVVSKSFLLRHHLRDQFLKEIKIHFDIDHPNVVKLFKVFENPKYMYLVLELGENGTLQELIERRKSLSELEARYYLRSLLEGINYIHSKSVLHRDLKPANLLISKDMQLKIADFGLAAHIPRLKGRRRTFCGTPYFIAPEIITKQGHSYEVDYWSVGIILYNMLCGKCPFQSESAEEVYKMVLEGQIEIPTELSKEASDLIKALVEKDVSARWSYEDILKSKFMVAGNKPDFLPLSTLETAPSESFLVQFDENLKIQDGGLLKVQNNVYKKTDSRNSSLYEDIGAKENLTDYEYVKKWVNFSEKFGIGTILNNGIICVYFNDKSKIVLSNFGITFHYISSNSKEPIESYNILKYPKELDKKVKLLDYFIKYLKANSHLVKVKEEMPDNFVHVTNYKITKYAVLFLLSNGLYQMIFQDGTEVHVSKSEGRRKVLYIDAARNKVQCEAQSVKDPNILSRLEHINECIKNISQK